MQKENIEGGLPMRRNAPEQFRIGSSADAVRTADAD